VTSAYGQVVLCRSTVGTPLFSWYPYVPSPQALTPRTRYQKESSAAGVSESSIVVPETAFPRHDSSPPPGPTGSALTSPRSTDDAELPAAAVQEIVATPAFWETWSALPTSPGGGTASPEQIPPAHASAVVQALASSQVVPSGRAGFEQAPVPMSQVPASWHWSLGVQTTGFEPVHTPAWQVSVCVHPSRSLQAEPFGAPTQTVGTTVVAVTDDGVPGRKSPTRMFPVPGATFASNRKL